MPKVLPDAQLHLDIKAVIAHYGSCSAVAAKYGLDRSLLWKFQNTGCAIPRTRLKLQELVMDFKNATKKATNATIGSEAADGVHLSPENLSQVRALCHGLLKLIDTYEAALQVPSRRNVAIDQG